MKISSLKFLSLRLWQYLALISGAIIALVMGLASVSYSATLGSDEPAFPVLPVTNTQLFSGLAFAFELAMIASVFGFWHWHWCQRERNLLAAIFCLALFAISSTYSVHAVHGYIALNVTKTQSRDVRSQDISGSLKRELDEAQAHLSALNVSLLKSHGRRRAALAREISEQRRIIDATRARLASSGITAHVSPMAGLEWFLALSLWWMNATCWTAWFGTGAEPKYRECDSVSDWLQDYDGENPEHCARLYRHYLSWCTQHSCTPLVQYSFYARLIELGGEKFRKNGNGATCYRLPQALVQNDRLEA